MSSRVRLAAAADAGRLDAWLQAAQPLPVAAARARQALVESLLARPERGACVVAEGMAGEGGPALLGCLPATLVPHLGLGGLAAFAAEWWTLPGAGAQDAALLACCGLLADWCRAHGVRHLLLAPALLAAPRAAAAGFVPHAGGLWHRSLAPAHKHLG
ncbi:MULTISPECIES: hypothetical protein [Cupriavidus]